MRNFKIGFLFASVALAGLVGCEDDPNTPPVTIDAAPTIDVNTIDVNPADPDAAPMDINVDTDVTTNTTWTSPNTYFLKKHVFVKGGATLTIEAGVIVKGDQGTSLVITREGKINAVGTAAKPIVFTSVKPEGERAPGDWGGIVLLGKAKINDTAGELGIEGFPAGTADVLYGGGANPDDAHNCGTLKYVRVEFPGFQLEPNKELNGISVGACGTGTTLDFIQIHKSSDDGIEFFGGTVGLKHAVVDQGLDDGVDWDFGWTGKVQFVIAQTGLGDGENGMECDNHPTNYDLLPRSQPTIYNVTLVGPVVDPANPGKKKQGMLFRHGTWAKVENAIVTGYNGMAIDVRDTSVIAGYPANLFAKHSIFFGNQTPWNEATAPADEGAAPGFNEGAEFTVGGFVNKEVDPKLPAAAFNFAAPNFKPEAGSPALLPANAATPPAAEGFDATATFIGAIGADDWTAGWTSFPQN